MHMMRKSIAVAAAALLLAGCGSSGDGAPSPTSPAPASSSALPSVEVVNDLGVVATRINCIGYTDDTETISPFTQQYGDCIMDNDGSGSVQLYRFGTTQAIDSFWEFVAEFGITPSQCAQAGLVVACPEEASDIAGIQAALATLT